jgi:hypothetical protein
MASIDVKNGSKKGHFKVMFAGPEQTVLGVSGCTALFRQCSKCTAVDVEPWLGVMLAVCTKGGNAISSEMPHGAKKCLLTVVASNFQGTAGALARAKWVLAYLQTNDRAYACRVSGLSRSAHVRIIAMLSRNGHLEDSDRSGRPAVYTEAMMEAAYVRVVNDTTGKLTGKSLVQLLKREGQLHLTADVQWFLEQLTTHIKQKGQKLLTNYRRTTFRLSKRDEGVRLACAHVTLRLVDAGYLDSFVFEDEVVLEESPHPKGVMGWEPVSAG